MVCMICRDTCCTGDRDGPEVKMLSSAAHNAAKEYKCNMCSNGIKPGERYVRMVWLVDGEIQTHREHVDQCFEYTS